MKKTQDTTRIRCMTFHHAQDSQYIIRCLDLYTAYWWLECFLKSVESHNITDARAAVIDADYITRRTRAGTTLRRCHTPILTAQRCTAPDTWKSQQIRLHIISIIIWQTRNPWHTSEIHCNNLLFVLAHVILKLYEKYLKVAKRVRTVILDYIWALNAGR